MWYDEMCNYKMFFMDRGKMFFLCFFVLILCIFNASFVHAQEEEQQEFASATGLQVSPIRFDWEMGSGEEHVGKINVKNYADKRREVSISVKNFFVTPDSEHVNLFGGEESHPRHMFNVIEWFALPEDFVLEPGEARDVEFRVVVPEGQPTNGYYGTILFQTTNSTDDEEDKKGTELSINYRVGVIMTLAVRGEGEPKIDGVLERFEGAENFYIDSPIKFDAEVANTGNIHYKMSGAIDIMRFGKKFATVEIEPAVMYPDAKRVFEEDAHFGAWDFGIYKAHIALESEHGDVTLTADTENFYVLPRQGLIYIGVGFVIMLIIFILFKYVFRVSLRRD